MNRLIKFPFLTLLILLPLCATSQESNKDLIAEARAKHNKGWKFPVQGMVGRYDAELEGIIYDLDDGFYGHRFKVGKRETAVITIPADARKLNDEDLAFLVADKSVYLHYLYAKAVLPPNALGARRYRTMLGQTVLVGVAPDRNTAIVTILNPSSRPKERAKRKD